MITQSELDGVPVLLIPAPGLMRAGLVFRVGFADEPLARHGITHLLEHLALYPLGLSDHHFNGTTGVEHTSFHMQGLPDDVTRFLTGVCASLQDLPMHRLDVEKELLRTEANGRGEGALDVMPLWRHGARDYGVSSYPEFGLPAITADELRAWAARYFTRDNAVLWIAGDHVPAGLRLPLPAGRREPLPTPSNALPVTPAFFRGSPGVVAWNATVPRNPASQVFADLLEREMYRALRQEAGLSYTAGASYRESGTDAAMVVAVADALPEKQEAVFGGLVDVLTTLQVGRIDQADLAIVVRQRGETLWNADQQGTRVAGEAAALLAGRRVRQVEDEIAEIMAVTVGDVTAVAGTARDSGLLMAPKGVDARWAGFQPPRDRSEHMIIGTAHAAHSGPDAHLITGEEGVTLVDGDDHQTVRLAACSIVQAWPDGGRLFVGHDGIMVRVEPTLFRDGHEAVAFLDARIPPGLRVDQPARSPDQIPAPQSGRPRPEPPPTRAEKLEARRIRAGYVLAVIFGLGIVSRILRIAGNRYGEDVQFAVLIVLLVGGAVIAGSLIRARRRRVA
ncbi:insulinase family protein [Actinoplanes philippinensis]|uniref:insulinase family protein n=1 Tax=Actinoplanes philippinensis TaxID=35752 RepID=UPI0033D8AB27